MSRKAWLVTLTAIGVAILFALGWWQKERLEWKAAYLADVEAAVTAEPLRSLDALDRLLQSDDPVNYRRIAIEPAPVPDAPLYRVFRGNGFKWEIFTPVEIEGRSVFAGLGEIANDAPITAGIPARLVGYVRQYEPGDLEGGNYAVAENRYYIFNQDFTWRDRSEPYATLYIDHDPSLASADAIPIRRPDIPNNHFQYMLTWWSFAIILVIVSAILYRREA